MKVSINSLKFKTDKVLEEFISDKISKLSSNYNGIISSEVTFKIDNAENQNNKVAEIKLLIPGNDLFARKQSKSFEDAADQAIDALRKQLVKHKEKQKRI